MPRVLITGGSGLLALNWACCMCESWEVILAQHTRKIALPGARSVPISLEPEQTLVKQLEQLLPDLVVQERPRDDIGEAAARKLVEYLEGRRVVFDEPMDLSLVPPFTQGVLRATSRIPYGEVRPYAWVAREVGKPRATRAVGQSLHINPLSPIIPCHRVIASDNTLGGYGGGLDMKRWLLKLEGYL